MRVWQNLRENYPDLKLSKGITPLKASYWGFITEQPLFRFLVLSGPFSQPPSCLQHTKSTAIPSPALHGNPCPTCFL